MKAAGFTFIRNALKLDFPVVEAISSVLPLCDEFYVAVGNSKDETLALIQNIPSGKIRIIQTSWNTGLMKGGAVYADETNKAFDAIPAGYDWCFYIQGDDVMHEKYLDSVKSAMLKWKDVSGVDGLLFRYVHFYGTFDYVADSRHWYRNEVRIIRNDKSIRSFRDAQGFRRNGQKLKVVPVDAAIFHYGWVRHPLFMQLKSDAVRQFYDGQRASVPDTQQEYNYSCHYDSLTRFTETHPGVMQERISRLNWQVDVDLKHKNMNLRYLLLFWFEKITGIRPFEFRNYVLMKGKGRGRGKSRQQQ